MSAIYPPVIPMTPEEEAAADAEILSWGSVEGWFCHPCDTLWSFAKVDWGECPECGANCALRFYDGECVITDIMPDCSVVQQECCDEEQEEAS